TRALPGGTRDRCLPSSRPLTVAALFCGLDLCSLASLLKLLVTLLEDEDVIDDRFHEVAHVLRIQLRHTRTDVVGRGVACETQCRAPIVEPSVNITLGSQLVY